VNVPDMPGPDIPAAEVRYAPIDIELPGAHLQLGWGLIDTQPVVGVTVDDGKSRTILLANPAQTDWMADFLHEEEAADDLAADFRRAAHEARQLYAVALASAKATIGSLRATIDELIRRTRRELKEWSTTTELCEWLGIAVPSLHWLHATGQGPQRHRIGKQNRYRRGEVEEWLATRVIAT